MQIALARHDAIIGTAVERANGLWLLYEGRGLFQGMIELITTLLEVLAKAPSMPEHAQQEIMTIPTP